MKKFMKWYYGTASIRKKLVISYLTLVLVPIIVLGLYAYHISRKNLIEQTCDAITSNADAIAYSLESNIQRENDNLKYLSYNSRFRESLENGKRIVLAREMNRTVEPTFWYFIASDRNIKKIEIFTPYLENALGSFLKPKSTCSEELYEYHKEKFKTLWTCEENKIFATRTILDADTSSRAIGVMKLEVYQERFMEPLQQGQYLGNGILLLNEQKQEISSRKVQDENIEAEIRETITKETKPGLMETKRFILNISEPLENGWQLYYYVDKKEIAGEMRTILCTTLFMAGCCLLLISTLIDLISRILCNRILQLKHCAEQVGEGNFEITTESGYTDEIGVVANSLQVMSQKISEMMDQVYRMGLEKRATELKALQAMLNPHFLYNCLSSVKWKAIRSDQMEIADITGLLAKFYRTTLNEGKQITTVSNELENVKAYLEIQSRMHDRNFDIEYCLSKENLSCEIPNFLLQPIVENAICHGIEYCAEEERGKIRVEYGTEEEYLLFRICNNGPSLKEEDLQKILNEPGKGYGIYSIQERIRMYYDDTCGVFTSRSEEGYTCFTIRLRKQIVHQIKDRIGEEKGNT